MEDLTWIDWVLAAAAFGILWFCAGEAGWYAEILRITLILMAIEMGLMYWLRHAN